MVARGIGSATISFGLVSIPVKVYASSRPASTLSFHLLHAKCGSRLKQQYICPTDANQVVGRAAMVKGYEVAKGRYVTFTDDELRALGEEASKTVAITEFVPADAVDPLYYDSASYLGPAAGGERAYALLNRALHASRRVALAQYAARGKQYLVMLRPHGPVLVMQQLHYADELQPVSDVPLSSTEVKDAELDMALQLIEHHAGSTFEPQQYKDAVKERLQAAIAAKVDGREVKAAPSEAPRAQIIDLMQALKASLGAGEGTATKPGKHAKPTKRPKRATRNIGAQTASSRGARRKHVGRKTRGG